MQTIFSELLKNKENKKKLLNIEIIQKINLDLLSNNYLFTLKFSQ